MLCGACVVLGCLIVWPLAVMIGSVREERLGRPHGPRGPRPTYARPVRCY